MASDILKVFGDVATNADGTIQKECLVAVLQKLLPDVTPPDLEALVETLASDGTVNVADFVDDLFNAGAHVEPRFPGEPMHRCNSVHHGYGNLQDGSCESAHQPSIMSWSTKCTLDDRHSNIAFKMAEAARELLPERVILVRHGESEGNVDQEVYRYKADNRIELTEKGSEQALKAGRRIKQIVGDDRIQLIVSPFQRTLQTARNILEAIRPQVINDIKDPRIREQEFGNLQRDDFIAYRKEQKTVGRYFYRFPTGESGADVHARVKDWWDSCLLQLNLRPGHERVNTVVVVTHGLTMRFILMQLYDWSPNTFETIWNAGNCDIYVLKKDLALPGHSPYALCPIEGDMPSSSIRLCVTFKDGRKEEHVLSDYLSIPQPRTRQPEIAKHMLSRQHGLDVSTIANVDFYAGKFSKWR